MAKELPLYKKPLRFHNEPKITGERWQEAVELFEEQKYRASVVEVMNYLNIDLLKGQTKKEEIHIERLHGICKVDIDISESSFKIRAYMADVTEETNLVALLRRIAELNFHYNDVAFIIYKDQEIYYEYEEQTALCEPYKLYYIIKDVLLAADRYANEFIVHYAVKEIDNLKKNMLTSKEQDEALMQIRAYLDEYTDYVEYFKSNSKDAYIWDISIITLLKLSNMSYFNGVYKNELISKIAVLYDGDLEFNYKIDNAKKYIKTLQALTDDDFKRVLYYRDDLISMMKPASNENIKPHLNNYEETLLKYEKEDNHHAISYYLEELFLKILYNNNLEKNHQEYIENVLVKTSKTDSKKASKELIKLYNKLREIDFDKAPKTLLDKVLDYWWVLLILYFFIEGWIKHAS